MLTRKGRKKKQRQEEADLSDGLGASFAPLNRGEPARKEEPDKQPPVYKGVFTEGLLSFSRRQPVDYTKLSRKIIRKKEKMCVSG